MNIENKVLKEEFAKFFESPSREELRELIKNNLGELTSCDFKGQWPAFSKVAKHSLGMANWGGGCIIIGVAEKSDTTLEATGIDGFKDKSQVYNGLEKYLPNTLHQNVKVLDFFYEASEYPAIVGKKFQVIYIEDDPEHLPFLATADGDDIRANTVYVRRGTSTEVANYEELQNIINRRLETGYSSRREISLRSHIEQLKTLYSYTDKQPVSSPWELALENLSVLEAGLGLKKVQAPNPFYPKESFEEFMLKVVERKKKRIEIELDISNLTN